MPNTHQAMEAAATPAGTVRRTERLVELGLLVFKDQTRVIEKINGVWTITSLAEGTPLDGKPITAGEPLDPVGRHLVFKDEEDITDFLQASRDSQPRLCRYIQAIRPIRIQSLVMTVDELFPGLDVPLSGSHRRPTVEHLLRKFEAVNRPESQGRNRLISMFYSNRQASQAIFDWTSDSLVWAALLYFHAESERRRIISFDRKLWPAAVKYSTLLETCGQEGVQALIDDGRLFSAPTDKQRAVLVFGIEEMGPDHLFMVQKDRAKIWPMPDGGYRQFQPIQLTAPIDVLAAVNAGGSRAHIQAREEDPERSALVSA